MPWQEDKERDIRMNLVDEEPRKDEQQEPIEIHLKEGEHLLVGSG